MSNIASEESRPARPVVFVSYSHKDAELVERLAPKLQGDPDDNNTAGYLLWWDKGLAKGDRYQEVLKRWIEHSALVLVVLSSGLLETGPSYVWEQEVPQALRQSHTTTTWLLGTSCGWKKYEKVPEALPQLAVNPRYVLLGGIGDATEPSLQELLETGRVDRFNARAAEIDSWINHTLGRASIPDACVMTEREMELLAEGVNAGLAGSARSEAGAERTSVDEPNEDQRAETALATSRATLELPAGAAIGAVRLASGGSRLLGVGGQELWGRDLTGGDAQSIRLSHAATGGVLSGQGRHLVVFGGSEGSLYTTLRGELRGESRLDGELEGPVLAAWESGPNLWLLYQREGGCREGCVPLRPGPGGRRRFRESDMEPLSGLVVEASRFGESVVGRDPEGRLVGAEALRSAGLPDGPWQSIDACVVEEGWLWVGLMAGGEQLWFVLVRENTSSQSWSCRVGTPGTQVFLERPAGLGVDIAGPDGVLPVARLWLVGDGCADLYDIVGPEQGSA